MEHDNTCSFLNQYGRGGNPCDCAVKRREWLDKKQEEGSRRQGEGRRQGPEGSREEGFCTLCIRGLYPHQETKECYFTKENFTINEEWEKIK